MQNGNINQGRDSLVSVTVDKLQSMSQYRRMKDDYDEIGKRLRRSRGHELRRRQIAVYSLTFACLTIVLAVIEIELTTSGVYESASGVSLAICTTISLLTVLLLITVVTYHTILAKRFAERHKVGHWVCGFTTRRSLCLLLEILTCSIHPFPGAGLVDMSSRSNIPLPVYLTVPMFLRFYLVARVAILQTRLFTDQSSLSLGALSKVNMNMSFIFKCLMTIHARLIMCGAIVLVLSSATWCMHICESFYQPRMDNILNALYLVAITYLTVGYGDYSPESYCGRTVSVVSGLFGSACTVLVVAMVAKTLQMSRAERSVYFLRRKRHLENSLQNAAAGVIWYAWRALIHRRNNSMSCYFRTQRQVLEAVQRMRSFRNELQQLEEACVDVGDVSYRVDELMQNVKFLQDNQEQMRQQLKHLVFSLGSVHELLGSMMTELKDQKR